LRLVLFGFLKMGWCCSCCPFGQPFFSIADNKEQEQEQALDAASNMVNLKIDDPELVPANGQGHHTTSSIAEEECEELTHEVQSRNKSAEDSEEDKDEDDTKQHLNVVFIGHVDAGKSTIGGQILYLSNMVDERTIQKYEREAKEKNRESWYMAYIMDTNEEERAKVDSANPIGRKGKCLKGFQNLGFSQRINLLFFNCLHFATLVTVAGQDSGSRQSTF
jgi:hypothetical protein